MSGNETGPITREELFEYFQRAAKPRSEWRVGMEVERLARDASTGLPIPYQADGPSVRKALECYRAERGGNPIWEGDHLIGLDGPWGSITLEPGGQIEWSSRPYRSLHELNVALQDHMAALDRVTVDVGIRWVEAAVDPVHSVS